jgi:hypothetical protein
MTAAKWNGTDCARLIARGGWGEDRALARCAFPIGPRNTASNAAYPMAGLALYLRYPTPETAAFAVCLLALGLGSAAYHGWKTIQTNNLDWAGMYAVFVALVLHAVAPGLGWWAWLTVPTAGTFAYLFAYRLNGLGLNAHMGLFLLLAMLPPLLHGHALLALVGFGLFLLAYGCWTLDHRTRVMGLWGHALWHILTAAAIATVYAAGMP